MAMCTESGCSRMSEAALQRESNSLQREHDVLLQLARGMGFDVKPGQGPSVVFTHKRAKACRCGKAPQIEAYMYKPRTWITICPKCAIRTELADTPIDAVRKWNREEYSELTWLTMEKLTKETLDPVGAVNLAEAMKKQAVRDLIDAERCGLLDSPLAQQAIWFIHNDQVVQDIVSGNRRRREEEAKKNGTYQGLQDL